MIYVSGLAALQTFLLWALIFLPLKLIALHYNGHNASQAWLTVS